MQKQNNIENMNGKLQTIKEAASVTGETKGDNSEQMIKKRHMVVNDYRDKTEN